MPPVKTFGERIAEALVEDGLLTNKQVEELLEQQKKEGTRLLKLLLEKSYVSEQDMAISMGRVLNVPPINLARISVPLEIAELLPREMAHNYKVVPVSRLENKLFLAMADPLNVLAVDDVNLDIYPGEVHVVAGENGAGKSTLMKLLSQVEQPTSGTVLLNEREVPFVNPQHAQRLGVSQAQVARMEKRGYDAYTLTSLRRYVKALGEGFELEVSVREPALPNTTSQSALSH